MSTSEILQEFRNTYIGSNTEIKKQMLKKSYQFSEAYTIYDLYKIRNRQIINDTYLICHKGTSNIYPVIMKKRPLLQSKLIESYQNLTNMDSVNNDDHDTYRCAKTIIDNLEKDMVCVMILSVDNYENLDLDNVSVLVVIKHRNKPVDILLIDTGMHLAFEWDMGQHFGETVHSNVHQCMASSEYQLKVSMVEVLFHNVINKQIHRVPLKTYAISFNPISFRVFFPVCVILILNMTLDGTSAINIDNIYEALESKDTLRITTQTLSPSN